MAEDLQLSVRLAMESQSFQSQITTINRQMQVVQSEFNNASTALNGFGSETQRLEGRTVTLTQQIQMSQQKIDLLTQAHERSKAVLASNVSANEALRQQVARTTEAYNASVTATGANSTESQRLQTELTQLNTEFTQSNATIIRNNSSMDNLNIRLQNTQTQQNRLQGELTQTNRDLELQNSNWTHLSTALNTASTNMQAVGAKMTSIGKTLSLSVTTPILAMGTAAVKTGMDFDSAMSRVKAISSSTGEEFKALEKSALDLGASSAFSATQVAGAQESMASAGFKVNEILAATPGVLDLAASSGEDLATSSKIAAGAIRGFGLEASQSAHVADVLARSAADTNAGVASMGQAFSYVAPLARGVGWDIESVAAAVGAMADANIDGSTSGTVLRGVISRLANPSDEASKSMETLGFKAFDSQGKMKSLSTITDELSKSMVGLTDEQKQQNISTIFGQEAMSGFMVLMQKGKPALDELANGFKNCDGTAKQMAETMQDNAKASIDGMMGSLETAAIKIEQAVAPTITKFAEKVTELANKFSELSPETQEMIIKMGLAAAAMGPILLVGGKLITVGGAIAKVFAGISAAMGAASVATAGTGVAVAGATPALTGIGVAFGAALVPLLPWIAGIGAVVAVGALLVNHLKQDAIPAVDLFAEGTSSATKKAVQSYLDLDTNATKSLMNLNFSGQAISKETAASLAKTFDDMGTQIKAGMDKHYSESLKTMRETFAKSSALTTTEEASILAKMKVDNDNKKASVDAGEKQIKAILDTASAAKRTLTTEEQTKINEIQATMKTNAVKSLSDTEVESKSILERMKQQAGEITTRQAAEVVKNSLEQKDKAVKNANDQYNETVKAIIKQRDETGTISAEQAQKLISDAEKTKNNTVKSATDMNSKVVEQAKLQAKSHVKEVDWTTGEIKSKWQVMKEDIGTKMDDIGAKTSAKWEGIKKDTKIKVDELKTGVSDTFKSLGTLVETTWDGIKNSIKNSINGVSGLINSFISFVNNIRINIPAVDIPLVGTVGGYSIGMPQIPSIPMLAEGGITNGPMHAIIGDNKSGREAVIPIEKIDDIIASAINKANGSNKNDTPQNITINADFSGVNSKAEIEGAFKDMFGNLKNIANQKIRQW